jgi:hypothetical protein
LGFPTGWSSPRTRTHCYKSTRLHQLIFWRHHQVAPDDPEDAPGLQLAVAHSLAGAGGAAGGAPSGQPVFDISDSDDDVKPDVKLEDGIAVAAAAAIRVRILEIFVNPHKFAPNSMKIHGFL